MFNKPKIGKKAPDFSLPTHLGGRIRLSDYRGKSNVVIAFYPLDYTPVCSNQMPSYENQLDEFTKLNTQVLGISADSIPAHQSWSKSIGGISFHLLSDFWPHGEVARKFGVFLDDKGIPDRYIFIVDKEGIIRYIEHVGLKNIPDNTKIISFLKSLENGQ